VNAPLCRSPAITRAPIVSDTRNPARVYHSIDFGSVASAILAAKPPAKSFTTLSRRMNITPPAMNVVSTASPRLALNRHHVFHPAAIWLRTITSHRVPVDRRTPP